MQTIGTLVGGIAHDFNNFGTFTDGSAGLQSQTAWVLWMNGINGLCPDGILKNGSNKRVAKWIESIGACPVKSGCFI